MPQGGSWWPSLAWPTLPQGIQLPGLASFTTRHWQRKLIRYLIRRTLGGFLRIPEDDIESSTFLDADLSSGQLRLRNVELDEEVSPFQLGMSHRIVASRASVERTPSDRSIGHQSTS